MKKYLLLTVFLIFSKSIFSQITITADDYMNGYAAGKSWTVYSVDSLKEVTMNIGSPANTAQSWTYPSGIKFTDTMVYKNIVPSASPFSTAFPNATHCSYTTMAMEEGTFTSFIYFLMTKEVILSLGVASVFNGVPFKTDIKTDSTWRPPLTYGSHWSRMDSSESYGSTSVMYLNEVVDGFGTLKIGDASIDVLRSTRITEAKLYAAGNLISKKVTRQIYFTGKSSSFTIDLDTLTQATGNIPVYGLEMYLYNNTTLSVDNNSKTGVQQFLLEQNYPNPFNPLTNISYSVPEKSFVSLKVYNLLGSAVATLVNETREKGKYTIRFDGSNLASGIYFYKLDAGNFSDIKKLVLLK